MNRSNKESNAGGGEKHQNKPEADMKPFNLPTEKLFKVLMRYKYLLLVIAAGIVILLWPSGGAGGSGNSSDGYPAFSVEDMEQKLEAALSSMEGAGRVQVVLSLRSDMSIVVQEDVNSQSSRKMENGEMTDYDTMSQRKTVMASSGSEQKPVVTKRIYPEFEGALVICDGGDKAGVRLAVSEAVSALTGLGSDKITILKMKK